MPEGNWKDFIRKVKEEYKNLGFVECPAFGGEKVYFNHYGIGHLIYKNGEPRPRDQVIERFGLLSHVHSVIKNTKSVYYEEKRPQGKTYAYYWTIKYRIHNIGIRIILRRIDNGTIHFFSIMRE